MFLSHQVCWHVLQRFFVNAGLFLASLFFAFFLAECAWRFFVSKGDLAREYDPELGRVNQRNAEWTIRTLEYETVMKTNAHGFRGPEFPSAKEPDEFRVLFLGDSFVEAKQVPLEERFAEQSGEILKRKLRRPVVVRVLAVGAAEPARELLFYRNLGREFAPHIVVQVLFPENDLLGMSGAYRFRGGSDGALILEDVWVDPPTSCAWKCQILRRSEIAVAAYRLFRQWRFTEPTQSTRALLGEGEFYWYTSEGQESMRRERRLEVLRAFIRSLKQDVERDGRTFFVVLMPGGFEIHDDWWEEILERFSDRITQEEWNPPGLLDAVSGTLTSAGIDILDLRPAFHARAKDGAKLYYKLDPHLRPEGHRVAAAAIAEVLISSFAPASLPY